MAFQCEHAAELANASDDDGCPWCDEVEALRADNRALREQLHRQAVILSPGVHHLDCGTVGYLVMLDGAEAHFGTLAVDTITPRSTV